MHSATKLVVHKHF